MAIRGWKLAIHERECFKCKICGSSKNLTIHHKLPVARGGRSNLENCVCWCRDCHREYHKNWGLTESDDFGNPIEEMYATKKKRKRKKKHRR